MVTRWGLYAFPEVLEDALTNFGVAADKIVGILLNQVDYQQLRNMEAYSHGYYYNKHYAKYGYVYSDN